VAIGPPKRLSAEADNWGMTHAIPAATKIKTPAQSPGHFLRRRNDY
jgi:hypothetical protein